MINFTSCSEQKNLKSKSELKKLNLNEKEKIEDYEFFWDFINEGFPFTEILIENGANLNEIKTTYKEKLKKIKSKEAYLGFYGRICNELTQGLPIGHFSPIPYDIYKTNYSNRYPSVNIYFLKNKKIKDFYATRMRASWPLGKFYTYTQKVTKPKLSIIEEGNIACIRIDSFYIIGKNRKEFFKSIDNFLRETENYKHLIIDITRNNGGHPRAWRYLVSRLIKEDTKYQRYALYKKTKYNKYHLNMCFLSKKIKGINIKEVPNYRNIKTKKFNKACVETSIIYKNPLDSYNYNQEKKIWLLIGKESYSASDRFAGFCKSSKFATTVGERGLGCGMNIFGPMPLALPNSGALFLYEFTYGLNEDASCNATIGTEPDIYNKPGKTAMETCLEEIKKYDRKNK